MSIDNSLIKKPHMAMSYTEEQILEFIKCADPITGPEYFLRNYFYIQHPVKGQIKYEPFDFQLDLIKNYHENRYSVSMVSRQMGKALALDTPVLTPSGFSTIGELSVGDQVFGPDGKPTVVNFITETMHDRKCYNVEFAHGETIVADAEHLWTVVLPYRNRRTKTVTTDQMIELHTKFKKLGKRIFIHHTKEIEFPDHEVSNPFEYGKQLAHAGGKIHSSYMFNSAHVRREVIRGILFAAGRSEGEKHDIYHSSVDLVDDMITIIASLGTKPTKVITSDGFIVKYHETPSDEHVYIRHITETESVPVRCLQVSNESHLFLCGKTLIPTHNTTTAAGYLLWYAMFVSDSIILVAAHKYSGAQEIMQRIRYAYEACPDFIRCGVTSYNKGSIEFDNRSRIVSSATTENTGRGMAISLLYCDEFSFVRPSISTAFYTSIMPTLSTGGKAIITSTPNSDEDQFGIIWREANMMIDEYGNATKVGKNGFSAYKAIWSAHPDRDEEWEKAERSRMSEEKFLREHCCEFVQTDDTLISTMCLRSLESSNPIEKQGQVRWFQKPQKGKTYLVALDPSLGTGSDPACIQVFQLQGMIQVAEWTHNKTIIHKQVAIMREIIKYISEVVDDITSVYYTVENNTIGEVALNAIEEIGEEHIPGVFLSEPIKAGTTRRYRKGYNTTNSKKLAACARLKQWLEGKKLKINSSGLISELKNFVSSGAGYAAKSGLHDDLVMATILVVRLAEQVKTYDPEVNDELTDGIEDIVVPMPFFVF